MNSPLTQAARVGQRTGTFFCESTTAHVLPLTPTEVIFAAVMALKAYSGNNQQAVVGTVRMEQSARIPGLANGTSSLGSQTNLVEPPSIREYSNVPISTRTA